jgi:hypothetical protein
LSADDWDAQMLYFVEKGYRVVAHDRRPLDAWLQDGPACVSLHALLNRLCRTGALVPGEYAVMRGAPRGIAL